MTILQRAQRYADFGYASAFKDRHPIQQWFRMGRYPAARHDAEGRWVERQYANRARIPPPVFSVPASHMQPLLPRWANR